MANGNIRLTFNSEKDKELERFGWSIFFIKKVVPVVTIFSSKRPIQL